MTLQAARALRDEILADGTHCVVPLGHGPDGYWAQIVTTVGDGIFHSDEQWQEYRKEREARRFRIMHPARSPIEMLIDKACGLA
jgi:hypothetical protein